MAWMDAIADVVRRYSGAAAGTALASDDPHEDFSHVAKTVPTAVTADALAHAFRSDQTPSFPEMVANLYQGSNPDQRAGLLNQLIGSVGLPALSDIPGLRDLAGSLENNPSITEDQAGRISSQQIRQAAERAQRADPSIVDQVSSFYAAHPGVIKALGTAAITLMLQHISRRA